MSRIAPVDPNTAPPAVTQLFATVKKEMGSVPNLISTMANSPVVAQAYLSFNQNLSKGQLPRRLREQLALVVGQANDCDYCIAAHTMLGKAAGLSEQATCDARRATSSDAKETAALEFARKVVADRGHVSDSDVDAVRGAGYTDGEIGEIVAHVALNTFTNYFNNVAETDIDFPAAPVVCAA